jgi:hypothetical protein
MLERPLLPRLLSLSCLAAASVSLLQGCASPMPDPEIASGRYLGPPLTVERFGTGTAVLMKAPQPGWEIRFDRSMEFLGGEELFLTVRRPNPRANYASREVDLRTTTTALAKTPVLIYARVLTWDEPARLDRAYGLATSDPANLSAPTR